MPDTKNRIGVGIIGCGCISQAYFNGAEQFDVLNIIACADINMAAARAKAEENGCIAQSVDELLANDDISLVINLTIPAVHAEVSMQILNAGKHVYCEKPLAVELKDGRQIMELARQKDLYVGCAPDTFLGAGLQTCRKLLDDGWIGKVTSGTAFMLSPGVESWHPNPGFYYQPGGGPLFDMGPYYLTALVHLLGPVKRVCAITSQARAQRIATCSEHYGEVLPVDVQTHYSGTLEFHSGAVITMTVSFDVYAHGHSPIELYGLNGSIKVPDPNTFSGPVNIFTNAAGEWKEQNLSHIYSDNMRGIGAADMAVAILEKREARASGERALHVLEIMHAFEQSDKTGTHVEIQTKPAQPAALPLGLRHGTVTNPGSK
jgi:predicted dehydrogenase